jgi:hypothetical protein
MKSVVIGGYNPEFSRASLLYAAEFDTGWFPLQDKDPVDLDQKWEGGLLFTGPPFPLLAAKSRKQEI